MSDAPERIWACVSKNTKSGLVAVLGGATFPVDGWQEYVRADRIEALTKERDAARQDAKAAEDELEMQEQEACMMENDYIKLEKERDTLEAKLATCEKYRDAYDEMGRIGTQAVRDLEAKLAKAVEALDAIRLYSSCGDTRRKAIETLAEIKGESHE